MKIQEIRYDDHPVLGDLLLLFTDSNGEVYDTIVFAGENGTGKTTILQTIASICSRLEPHCEIKCRLDELDKTELRELGLGGKILDDTILLVQPEQNSAVANVKYRLDTGLEKQETVWPNPQNRNTNLVAYYISTIIAKFKTNDREPSFQEVHNTTELTVDEATVSNRLQYANELNASELLVNINYQDAVELQKKVKDGVNVLPVDAENRITRFRKAFNDFFDNQLTFLAVEDFKIWFQKGNKRFEINQLSSGEKTIVQYGAFLLKDQNAGKTFISLIDEPEQSLHPRWENKILQYYKDVLTRNGQQLSQIFTTTHSEYVIKDAYDAKDLIIILKRKDDGTIEATSSLQLDLFSFSPTYNEIKYAAFNLVTPDFHSELFAHLQKYYTEQGGNNTIAEFDTWLASDLSCPNTTNITPNLHSDQTLPVYIRNFIDHPGDTNEQGEANRRKYNDSELILSIKYLINRIRTLQEG